ncbi:MAG: LptF/LptG family permease [Gemmatimonadaceae bacterium]
MKILTRYVLKEHVGPLIFSLATLTSVLLLNQVAKQFGNLVGKGLPWGVIVEFFLLSIPFIIAMTLPMAVLIAVLYAFSRLAAENEITALKASGVSIIRLMYPVMWGGVAMAAVMLAFNDQVLPRSNHRLSTLQTDIARKKPTFALREQVINEVSPGKLFLRAGQVDGATNRLREVTIYDLADPLRRRTIYADSGLMEMSANRRDLQMMLFDGYTQEIPRENPGELQRLYYRVDLIRVRGVGNQLERTEENAFKGDREMSICEMQRSYEESAREYDAARTDLASELAASVKRVLAAPQPADRRDSVRSRRLGLGSAYCGLMALLPTDDDTVSKPDAASDGSSADRLPPSAGMQQAVPHSDSRRPGPLPVDDAPLSMRVPTHVDSQPFLPPQLVAGSTSLIVPDTLLSASIPPAAESQRLFAATRAQLDVIRARMLDSQSRASQLDTEIQKKFALAAACIVFVLLGAPIALRFPRGGVGLVLAVSFSVFALYYVGLIAGETLADKLILSPFWAMWIANVVFTLVGVVLLVRVRKGGATARGGDTSELVDALRVWIARQARRVGVPLDRRRRTA